MSKSTVIQAPALLPSDLKSLVIFLSGSIPESSKSWHNDLIKALQDKEVTILNPLLASWDSSFKTEASYGPFNTQVNWELEGIERADIVVVFIEHGKKPFITMMELGLALGLKTGGQKAKEVIIGFEGDFHKRGNVDVMAKRFNAQVVDGLNVVVERIVELLESESEREI